MKKLASFIALNALLIGTISASLLNNKAVNLTVADDEMKSITFDYEHNHMPEMSNPDCLFFNDSGEEYIRGKCTTSALVGNGKEAFSFFNETDWSFNLTLYIYGVHDVTATYGKYHKWQHQNISVKDHPILDVLDDEKQQIVIEDSTGSEVKISFTGSGYFDDSVVSIVIHYSVANCRAAVENLE